ncbi:M1 family peptidase [Candidatus Parcubacteria bacterium]|nr:MAG: M1 family peptidase [Candidatus Parcubacteria bacterium]
MAKTAKNKVRLTKDIVPTKYQISLTPDLEAFVFEGEETIHLTLKKPTRAITLHSTELEIESAEIVTRTETIVAQKISYNEKAETATFTFKNNLPRGAVRLKLVFRGILNDRMHGFYRSSFEHGGKTRHMATTQFESTDARRAFPCFDEPAMKATFEVSLKVPTDMTAISNTMPTNIAEHASGYKTVSFEPTPLMSTYLLAFIVGDFEHIERKSKDGVLVRVFTTPGKKHQAEFALDAAEKIVSFFNSYFDIPYPMPVLDLIAIPDFAAGAMENWGAITYRESALLVDPQHSSTMNKQWVALVIAHEIAHQWFGNLVTMEWWTHLWLNEGFASYIEYLAVDHIFPEWDIWTQFLQSDHGVALHYDGLKNTHPIEVDVHHPAEIASVFDAVSYSKGASVIRMIAEFVGEKKFRDGLRHYLKKHKFSNTATEDLWAALSKTSGKPIGKIMANWTGKGGYPLVSIEDKGKHFELRQARFFASSIAAKPKDSTLWHIPIFFETGKGKRGQFVMRKKTDRFAKTDDSWIKLNANESAFFRTQYPENLREALSEPIRTRKLNTRDRLGLIRDMFALAETGKLSSVDGLAFARHYQNEDQYVVWSSIAGGFAKIHSLFGNEKFIKEYERYALDVFEHIGKKQDWDKQPKEHSAALLKVLILESLGKYGDEKTVAHARKLFDGIDEKTNSIPADLRGVVYNTVAKYGGAKEYEKLLKLYKAATLHEEKNRIGRALGSFQQKELLQKTLAFAISDDVRRQDSVRMIMGITVNPAGTDIAWRFIKKNWKTFLKRYQGSREVAYLLEPLGISTSTSMAKDVAAFLKKNPAPGTERTVQQVVERTHSNAAWAARDRKQIAAFLKN